MKMFFFFQFLAPFSILSLESKVLAGASTLHLSLCSFKLSLLFCVPQQKPNLSLLRAKPESLNVHRIMLIGKGRNRGRCHLICFRKSSITSTSLVKIICNTYNKNTGLCFCYILGGNRKSISRKTVV